MQIVSALAFVFSVISQGKPTPPPVMAQFEPLIGEWSGEVTLGVAPGAQIKGQTTFRFERVLDGIYVQLTLTQELPGMGTIRGITTFAYDPVQKKLRSYTFANGGMSDPSKPRVEFGLVDKGTLEMFSTESKPPYKQLYSVQPDGTLKFVFHMDTSGKGDLAEVGSGILLKKRGS